MGRSTSAQREELDDGNRDCNVDGYWHCGGDRADFGNHQDIQKMIICRVPDDSIAKKSFPLFLAREMFFDLICGEI